MKRKIFVGHLVERRGWFLFLETEPKIYFILAKFTDKNAAIVFCNETETEFNESPV